MTGMVYLWALNKMSTYTRPCQSIIQYGWRNSIHDSMDSLRHTNTELIATERKSEFFFTDKMHDRLSMSSWSVCSHIYKNSTILTQYWKYIHKTIFIEENIILVGGTQTQEELKDFSTVKIYCINVWNSQTK